MAKKEAPLPASLASYQATKAFSSFLLRSNSLSNPLSIVTIKMARSPLGCSGSVGSDGSGVDFFTIASAYASLAVSICIV
jgi:hypothetical protein